MPNDNQSDDEELQSKIDALKALASGGPMGSAGPTIGKTYQTYQDNKAAINKPGGEDTPRANMQEGEIKRGTGEQDQGPDPDTANFLKDQYGAAVRMKQSMGDYPSGPTGAALRQVEAENIQDPQQRENRFVGLKGMFLKNLP